MLQEYFNIQRPERLQINPFGGFGVSMAEISRDQVPGIAKLLSEVFRLLLSEVSETLS